MARNGTFRPAFRNFSKILSTFFKKMVVLQKILLFENPYWYQIIRQKSKQKEK